MHDRKVVNYGNESNKEKDKIKIAIDNIDHFKSKLNNFKQEKNIETIPK